MDVTYRNTTGDFAKLQSYVLKHTDSGRRSARNVFLSMTGVYALFCVVIGVFVHWLMAAACFAGGAAFFWFTKEAAITSQVKREYAKDIYAALFAPVTVSVEEDGLRTERPAGEGFYRWSEIDHVADTGGYLFVIMGAQGHVAIPAGAFDHPENKDRFYTVMRKNIDAARSAA